MKSQTPEEQTATSTPNDRFVALREILTHPPSQQHWRDIKHLFEEWPAGDERDVALDYTRSHLASWPDELRVAYVVWPHVIWPLARTINLSHSDADSYILEGLNATDSIKHIDSLIIRATDWQRFATEIKQRFSHLKSLTLIHCNNKEAAPSKKLSFEEVHLPELTHLTLRHCTRVDAILGLSKFTKLESLQLERIQPPFDPSCLRSLTTLKKLTLKQCSGMPHIQFVKNLTQLQQLTLAGIENIPNLDPLTGLTGLQTLFISDGKWVEDLSPLHTLKQLETLEIRGCQRLKHTEIEQHLPNLKQLTLRSLENLQQKTLSNPTLEHIHLSSFDKLKHLHIQDLPELKTLILSGKELRPGVELTTSTRPPRLAHLELGRAPSRILDDPKEIDACLSN